MSSAADLAGSYIVWRLGDYEYSPESFPTLTEAVKAGGNSPQSWVLTKRVNYEAVEKLEDGE